MMELIKQTYTIALPIVLGYIVWLLKSQAMERIKTDKRQKKEAENYSHGMMLLLRIQLIEYHDKYMDRGAIPSYAYENFLEMYETYHDLGGNGMVTKMYEEIRQLHLRKGKENEHECKD